MRLSLVCLGFVLYSMVPICAQEGATTRPPTDSSPTAIEIREIPIILTSEWGPAKRGDMPSGGAFFGTATDAVTVLLFDQTVNLTPKDKNLAYAESLRGEAANVSSGPTTRVFTAGGYNLASSRITYEKRDLYFRVDVVTLELTPGRLLGVLAKTVSSTEEIPDLSESYNPVLQGIVSWRNDIARRYPGATFPAENKLRPIVIKADLSGWDYDTDTGWYVRDGMHWQAGAEYGKTLDREKERISKANGIKKLMIEDLTSNLIDDRNRGEDGGVLITREFDESTKITVLRRHTEAKGKTDETVFWVSVTIPKTDQTPVTDSNLKTAKIAAMMRVLQNHQYRPDPPPLHERDKKH